MDGTIAQERGRKRYMKYIQERVIRLPLWYLGDKSGAKIKIFDLGAKTKMCSEDMIYIIMKNWNTCSRNKVYSLFKC